MPHVINHSHVQPNPMTHINYDKGVYREDLV